MKTAPFVAAFALSVVMEPAGALAPNCNGECTVTITMSAGCGSGIKVAPDPVVVAKDATAVITWQISSPGWEFAADGIVVQQVAPGAFDKDRAGTGKSVQIKNFNNKKNPRAYKYDVNLVDSKGARCSLDPTVVNQ